MLLDRSDRCINLCEIKFSETEFVISKSYLENLQRKKEVFKNDLKSRKNLFMTFISIFGIKDNEYYKKIIDNQVTINSFFTRD